MFNGSSYDKLCRLTRSGEFIISAGISGISVQTGRLPSTFLALNSAIIVKSNVLSLTSSRKSLQSNLETKRRMKIDSIPIKKQNICPQPECSGNQTGGNTVQNRSFTSGNPFSF